MKWLSQPAATNQRRAVASRYLTGICSNANSSSASAVSVRSASARLLTRLQRCACLARPNCLKSCYQQRQQRINTKLCGISNGEEMARYAKISIGVAAKENINNMA